MLKSLPPVGNPISLIPANEPEKVFGSVFGDQSVFLYGSGTMALAASLVAVREFRNIENPEVILPAYACPDLVSAALFAGLKPVLVDLEPDTPWMDLTILQNYLNPNTVAVVAAHFLGIPERLTDIRKLVKGTGVLVVEDSAQLFPVRPTTGIWEGDLVTLSFGRGKPISLLGGGAVLCQQSSLIEHLQMAEESRLDINEAVSMKPAVSYKTKVWLYNTLLAPSAYGIIKLLPFLHLGETIYKPLENLCSFEKSRTGLLAANIDIYLKRNRKQKDWISGMLQDIACDEISDLTTISPDSTALPLLRFPILVKSEALREKLFNAITKAGYGCSKMYPTQLTEIEGIEGVFHGESDFPQAKQFSQRLLTLPCHSGLCKRDVDRIAEVINSEIASCN